MALLVGLLTVGAACGDDPTVGSESSSQTTTSEDKAQVTTPDPTDPSDGSDLQTFTKEQSGETVQMKVGEEVIASLETCPGCGYYWEETSEPDSAIIKTLDKTETPPNNQSEDGSPIVGGSGSIEFHFEGVSAGTTEVEIGYFPPAEDQPEETFTLTFVVR